MQSEHAFVRNETFPSWWPNAVGKFLSVASPGFQLTLQDSTHVQVVAGPDDQAAVIAIAGLMRWNEATVNRAHPGGAAGSYDVFVTAAADSIVNTPDPFTDATNRAFALAILAAGSTPTIVAGTVDVYRKVGSVQWDGTKITGITRTVPPSSSFYQAGPQSARLALTAFDGLLWHETDTGLLFLGTGTTWLDLRIPGAWQPLTLASGVSAYSGSYTPSARLEGDVVRLKGSIQNNSGGSIANGTTVFSVPASMVNTLSGGAAINLLLAVPEIAGATVWLNAAAGSAAFSMHATSGNWTSLAVIDLNGLTYTIS